MTKEKTYKDMTTWEIYSHYKQVERDKRAHKLAREKRQNARKVAAPEHDGLIRHVMNHYGNNDPAPTIRESRRVLLGEKCITRADIVARYKRVSGSVVQRVIAADRIAEKPYDKILAVYVCRKRIRLLAAIVTIGAGSVTWHDVTVTGKMTPGERIPGVTNRLPARELARRIDPEHCYTWKHGRDSRIPFKTQTIVERIK